MQNRIVVIAGIKRSASTAMFNIVRVAMEEEGYKVNTHGQEYKVRDVPEKQVDLVKIHPFNKDIAKAADHIFITDRKGDDILKSLNRMWDSGNPRRLAGMRGQLALWMLHSSPEYYFYYRGSLSGWITRAVDVLGMGVSESVVRERFNEITPPENGQDKTTLLFANHIGNAD